MSYGKTFPQYLSKPYQVLWFEPDDMIMAYAAAIIFGFMIGGVFWVIVPIVPFAYGRMKKKYPRGFIKHVGYFLGIITFKGYPGFFQQKFRE